MTGAISNSLLTLISDWSNPVMAVFNLKPLSVTRVCQELRSYGHFWCHIEAHRQKWIRLVVHRLVVPRKKKQKTSHSKPIWAQLNLCLSPTSDLARPVTIEFTLKCVPFQWLGKFPVTFKVKLRYGLTTRSLRVQYGNTWPSNVVKRTPYSRIQHLCI